MLRAGSKVNEQSGVANIVEALGLAPNGELVAIVGGGGKSSLMFELAERLPGRGVMTTTTRIFSEQMSSAVECCTLADADWRARLTEIACVADRFTALTAHDPARPARTHRQIMLELTRQARSELSHEVVVALLLNWAPADAIARPQQSRSRERHAA